MAKLYEQRKEYRQQVCNLILESLKSIFHDFKETGVNLEDRMCQFSLPVVLVGEQYVYCYESVRMVEKTFRPYGWVCKMTGYKRKENPLDNSLEYWYTYSFSRQVTPNDDLPF